MRPFKIKGRTVKKLASLFILAASLHLSACQSLQLCFLQASASTETAVRHLTPGEAAVAKSIFGNQLDTEVVNLHMNLQRHPEAAAKTCRNDVYFWGQGFHENDYTKPGSIFNFGTSIHELTHVWQSQHGWRYTNTDPSLIKMYDYKIDTEPRDFKDYGMEQQASMVEDYTLYFLMPGQRTVKLSQTSRDRDLLKTIVERQFPEARKTREYIEAGHRLITYPEAG